MAIGRKHIAGFMTAALLAAGAPAMAQDAGSAKATPDALALNIEPGPATTDVLNLSSTLDGAFDEAFRKSLFEADSATDLRPDAALGFDRSYSAGGVAGLDIELQPRAGLRFGDEEDSALVGAVVRIGEDLKAGEVKPNTWYIFAGADAEAMHYSPNSLRGFTTGEFALTDRVIVGDAQAGIGYRIGDADVSLGYYRREVSSIEDNDPTNDFSLSEDAAAISFTWRR